MIVRNQQIAAFEDASRQQFEEEMAKHSKAFAPELCEVLGESQLRVVVRSGIDRSQRHGFTNRGPVRLFLELMFLFGSDFDTDPQFAEFGKVLRDSADQMARAQKMHEDSLVYLQKVAGPDNRNVTKALRELRTMARAPLPFSSGNITSEFLREMHRIFPEKAAYVGDAGLKVLIEGGIAAAAEYGFSAVRQQTLLMSLMFAFGHGCTHDPLYPWIERTLTDPKIVDADSRAERLERKAVTWLDHVLANPAVSPA